MLEISGTGAATEERIVAIEKKMRDMEALVKGLTQELLDLKSIAMKMSKQSEERSRQELKRVQAVAQDAPPQPAGTTSASGSSSTVVMRKGAKPVRCPTGTTGTGNGHDHAIRWNNEAGRTTGRQKLYRGISRIRKKQERYIRQG